MQIWDSLVRRLPIWSLCALCTCFSSRVTCQMRPLISMRGYVHPFVRPSIRPSVCPSVRLSVRPSVRPSVLTTEFKPTRDQASINAPAQRTLLMLSNLFYWMINSVQRVQTISDFGQIEFHFNKILILMPRTTFLMHALMHERMHSCMRLESNMNAPSVA